MILTKKDYLNIFNVLVGNNYIRTSIMANITLSFKGLSKCECLDYQVVNKIVSNISAHIDTLDVSGKDFKRSRRYIHHLCNNLEKFYETDKNGDFVQNFKAYENIYIAISDIRRCINIKSKVVQN